MNIDSPELALAKVIATKFHAGQLYGNQPYTYHLEEVAESVEEGTTDERLIIVAWLHDILEDTDCVEQVLTALFEDNIVDAVRAITRRKLETKADYLNRVKGNSMARLVKVHDSLCNLKASVMRFDEKRIKKYTEQLAILVTDGATT